MTGSNASATADREIATTRIFDASPAVVYDAWTQPDRVAAWWGPNGFTNTILEMDVRPGGVWRFIMHGPDGVDYPNRVDYLEVVPQQRLVYWHADDPVVEEQRFHVTVTFAERGGTTELTMRTVFATAEQLRRVTEEWGAVEGMQQTLNRLGEFLAGGVVS